MLDRSTPIQDFVAAAAARQPTPGGGSAAALTGALAASMGEMVVNYSLGRKGLESHTEALGAALRQFQNARGLLLELMEEDQSAYEALTAARKLPTASSERAQAIESALAASIAAPQAMAATAVSILELADSVVGIVNRFLLSDLAVCADLAMATARCAIHNVRVNLPQIEDQSRRWQLESSLGQLFSRAMMAISRVAPRIGARMATGQ